jgi:tetratricopeptide (TPR) repeat protein
MESETRRGRSRLITALAAVVLTAACAQSPQAKEAKYLEKGKKEFEKKNYSVALLYFKNAMAAQPRHAEPYYQLGLTHLAAKDPNMAAGFFKKATELDPKHTAAQVAFAGLLATAKNKELLEDGEQRMQAVLAQNPDHVEALNVLAMTELRLRKVDSAEAHLEQALRKSPGDLTASVTLSQVRLVRKDVAGAEEVLKQAAAQAPNSPGPRIYLAGFYFAQGKTAESEQQLRDALKIDPQNGTVLAQLAAMQAHEGQKDQAEQTYRQLAALPGRQYKSVHALYQLQSGKREEAVAELEKLAAADPEDRNIRTELVRAYLLLNRVADAERVLTAALKRNGLDVDALLQRSRIYLIGRRLDAAEADLNRVLHFRSNSAEAHYLLSQVGKARDNTAIQKLELGETLRLDPTFLSARIELARLLLAERAPDAVLKLMDDAPQSQKGAPQIAVQRNWALLMLGRQDEARGGVDQALSGAKHPEVLIQDAALKLVKKDFLGARAAAEQALAADPTEVRALELLMQAYAAQKLTLAGLQKVREHAARQPGSGQVQMFLGQLLSSGGDREGARKAFEAAKAAKADLFMADLALAELDTVEGKREDARRRFNTIVAEHPTNLRARLLFAQLEVTDGKSAAAIEQYRKAVELDGKNAVALNGLAFLLSESRQPDEAIKYAQKAKEVAPDNPAIDDTLGWTYYQKGMYAMAVTHLERATSSGGPAVRKYHLAMAYLKSGDTARGRKILDEALRLDPNVPEAALARQAFGIGGR